MRLDVMGPATADVHVVARALDHGIGSRACALAVRFVALGEATTPTAVRSDVAGNFASISGNKLALYYIVHNAAGGNVDGLVMQTTRAAVGQPWSAPTMVAVEGAIQVYSSIDISSDELSLLRAPTLAPQSHNLLISRRTSKTAPFDQTEVLQALDTSTSAFASARWSAHDTEIWVGQPSGMSEKPYVSHLR